MNIYSIVVCYKPNIIKLTRLVETLMLSGSKVILVDNTEASYIKSEASLSACNFILIGYNSGIAHAQNLGVKFGISQGAKAIGFFDQDSLISDPLLDGLFSSIKIGTLDIVAPLYFDESTGSPLPSLVLNKYGVPKKIHFEGIEQVYSVDAVISSGTVATREVFHVAGLFDEDFFIDYVDTEWCLRCRSFDIPIRVIPSVHMQNRIGIKTIDAKIITIYVHSPRRCYFQIRNSISLFRKPHIPIAFAVKEVFSIFLSRFILLILVKKRGDYLNAYFSGLYDGLIGVSGSKE
jgi:rhamnosyltransferase